MRSEYDQAGLNFETGGTRVERLAEAVTVIKGLLSGHQVTFAGRHYRVTATRFSRFPSNNRIRRSSLVAMAVGC
jgi:alkanesulfonate monooxygenase SsuD/methylene tetrahydromethanopterin reductase-like flavin-dependent oxidoreductase (luciferase family)